MFHERAGQRGSAESEFAIGPRPNGELCLACQHTSMIQLGCRPWNLSLTSVIVLALSNMLLTFLLLQSETCTPNSIPRELEANAITEWNLGTLVKDHPQECTTQDYQLPEADANNLKLDVKLGRWDSRRLFRTFDSVLVGSRFSEVSQAYRVCLATQSSVEKLHSVVQVAHHWTGPMSVALYAAGDEEFEVLQRYLSYLRRCYEPIRERVSFSLAVPKVRPPKKQPRSFDMPEIVDCAKPEATLNELVAGISSEQTNWRIRNVYPQNHMRNLARKNCQAEYVFLTDVDIVPSYNLSVSLDEFLKSDTCDKCAYVIPTYELDSRVRFPQNKSELVRLARKGLARPFHQKVFIHNQFATNFTRWILDISPGHKRYENVRSGRVYNSHDVTNFEFFYEPFYVAKDIAPAHDERFMGYGYTRNTQLSKPLIFDSKVNVIRLASKTMVVPTDSLATVTGWGKTEVAETSQRLQAVTVPLVHRNKCKNIYKNTYEITLRMLCAGYLNGGKDSCERDSGGPLVYNGVQIGIVFWGEMCASQNYPDVYTRVSAIRDWIYRMTKI